MQRVIFYRTWYLWCLLLPGLLVFACGESESEAEPVPHYNAVLTGQVIGLHTGKPVSRAMVSLCYHETEMLQEGLMIGGTDCEDPDATAISLTDGTFQLPVLADTSGLPTYGWVRIAHPDYEVMHEVYISLEPGLQDIGSIGMRIRSDGLSPLDVSKANTRKQFVPSRKGAVFVHDRSALMQRYSADSLLGLPSVRDRFPNGQYVRYYQPTRGYNARKAGLSGKKWSVWEILILPIDLAMAGVAEGEVGLFTNHSEAIKTQLIWARTYALHKALNEREPQNFQLAFSTTLSDQTLCAALETEGMILSHTFAPGGMGYPLLAVFSARCNGDFTQSGQLGKWSGCKLSGNFNPYLMSVACSGHLNCHEAGQRKNCCNIDPFWERYLYGHGAGGCQHGMKDFAEGNHPKAPEGLPYTVIAPYYFHGSKMIPFYGDVWSMPKPDPRGAPDA